MIKLKALVVCSVTKLRGIRLVSLLSLKHLVLALVQVLSRLTFHKLVALLFLKLNHKEPLALFLFKAKILC